MKFWAIFGVIAASAWCWSGNKAAFADMELPSKAFCEKQIKEGRLEFKMRAKEIGDRLSPAAHILDTFIFLLDEKDRELIRSYKEGVADVYSLEARLGPKIGMAERLTAGDPCRITLDASEISNGGGGAFNDYVKITTEKTCKIFITAGSRKITATGGVYYDHAGIRDFVRDRMLQLELGAESEERQLLWSKYRRALGNEHEYLVYEKHVPDSCFAQLMKQ